MISAVNINNVGFKGLFRIPLPPGEESARFSKAWDVLAIVDPVDDSFDPDNPKTKIYRETHRAPDAELPYIKIIAVKELDEAMRTELGKMGITDYEEKPYNESEIPKDMSEAKFDELWAGS